MKRKTLLRNCAVGFAAALLIPEIAIYFMARPNAAPARRGSCAVIVLGYPANSDGSPSPVQYFRMRAAQEAVSDLGCETLVLSGGGRQAKPEAEVLLGILGTQHWAPAKTIPEDASMNTWENIKNSLPMIPAADEIYLASDPAHALRARWYLCRQNAALCAHAHVAAKFHPLDGFFYQWLSVFYTVKSVVRDYFVFL